MDSAHKTLGIIDRPHIPRADSQGIENYKEWYHFNIIDEISGIDLVVNLSFSGNILVTGKGRTDLIILAHTKDHGWRGDIDPYEATATSIDQKTLDISLSDNHIVYRDGRYYITASLRNNEIELDIVITPISLPMMIWNNTPIGSGHLNWLIVPHLRTQGVLKIAGTQVDLDDVCAYHDHNWGFWKWGEDFGWEWGFTTDNKNSNENKYTIVFDRTLDRSGSTINEQTLAVWQGEDIVKLFTRRMIKARRSGIFRGHIPRLPGIMQIINQGEVLSIPMKYQISGRDDDDWLDITYQIDAGLQIAIPSDFGFGSMELNETFGPIEVRGEISGQAVSFKSRACFEFMS